MTEWVFNEAAWCYQEKGIQDYGISDDESSDSDSSDCLSNYNIGKNMAFKKGYMGYNVSLSTKELNASIQLETKKQRQKEEHERYKAKEADIEKKAKIIANDTKKNLMTPMFKTSLKLENDALKRKK